MGVQMTPWEVLMSLTPAQGMEIAASAAKILAAAYLARLVIKTLK